MKVKELMLDIDFVGAFDNCHIGCDSCDFITNTHTFYKDGKATGLSLKVECQNVEQCRHLLEHLEELRKEEVAKKFIEEF
jgi:hypothetical protein